MARGGWAEGRVRRWLILCALGAAPAFAASPDQARWAATAGCVTITRDEWGIAHVHGRTDADAVFGMIGAQAEDDFPRIEANYLTALGRTAEAEGEKAIWADLRQRLYVDPAQLQKDYAASPTWLRALMDAWADGLNHYLATHPAVHPKVLTHFEPWMALSFTEGSIGGDIERIDLKALEAFYGGKPEVALATDRHLIEPTGSNGIAIAPANTKDGHALLLINPHTSFFFRSELQMTSDAGLDAYGAATWGQFFIYQGFNPHVGWMHTSSGVDAVDEYVETLDPKTGGALYGGKVRPLTTRPITIRYRRPDGTLAERSFTARYSTHGPLVRSEGGRPVAFKMMWRPVPALEQSYLRTKARDYAGFLKIAALQANSSNDTLFADDKGTIAYLHPQFVPVRDDRFDYTKAVDGSDPATDWRGLTPLAKLPQAVNPPGGWAMNTNNAPWGAAGPASIRKADFPRYMDMVGDNPRGEHATRLLTGRKDFDAPGLIAAAYDSWLPTFATNVPLLAAAWDRLPAADPRKAKLAAPVKLLRDWDSRWAAASEATTLAVYWGTEMCTAILQGPCAAGKSPWARMAALDDSARLAALDRATAELTRLFGGWRVKWGDINRFQRNDAAIQQTFDDARPSTPVPFASALWGSLASFGAKPWPGTKKWYGTSGNSFVAVVEFGPALRAWAVTAGGESGDPTSPHFNDQVPRYAEGQLRPVHFQPADIAAHAQRTYHPGE
ncbi:penicillin acylase family protein [Sphingomonas sp. BIUV-7]|uniref:Penicillin acylase family protein n=1 Tax=Sphingomonas natans TaxID=3063330 RepID=A0ABT8YDQ5_9SPHN|nr:penicillin acylase family protein [Sphingomonas sp. BIUV-7]MDO6416506.1 penicillin acylase family protein [Sphingomonas sp. BIUV-7]